MAVENFGWIIAGVLAGSGSPSFSEDLVWLHEQGIRAIISLTERSLRRDKLAGPHVEKLGFVYRHLPIPDETAPTLAQVDEFVAFVDEMRARGLPVLAHCAGGYGRTGTLLACYLVSQGCAAQTAVEEIRASRPGSIRTKGQEACVYEYVRLWRERAGGKTIPYSPLAGIEEPGSSKF